MHTRCGYELTDFEVVHRKRGAGEKAREDHVDGDGEVTTHIALRQRQPNKEIRAAEINNIEKSVNRMQRAHLC